MDKRISLDDNKDIQPTPAKENPASVERLSRAQDNFKRGDGFTFPCKLLHYLIILVSFEN